MSTPHLETQNLPRREHQRGRTSRGRTLRLAAVPGKSAVELQHLFDTDFRARTTIALADATDPGTLPAGVAPMLRSEERHLDWHDALLWLQGELQVGTERMDYEQDPRLPALTKQLREVRVRLDECRILIRNYRRAARARTLQARITASADATALKWLTDVYPHEYKTRVQRVLADRGVGVAGGYAQDSFDFIEQGYAHRWITDEVTPEVQRLLRVSDGRFRELVAQDTRDPDSPIEGFGHPMVLRRWRDALRELAAARFMQAGAPSPDDLGPAPKRLWDASPQEADAILKARRLLAALIQRRIECLNLVRDTVAEIEQLHLDDPRRIAYAQAKKQARLALAGAHPEEYALIRNGLRRFESRPNVIDTALLPDADARGEVKRALIAAAIAHAAQSTEVAGARP